MSSLKKLMEKVAEAENHYYALPAPVAVTITGSGCCDIAKDYTLADGSLTIEPVGGNCVRLTAHPFPAEARLWNGPNVIPDDKPRSMAASLFHDLIWGHAEELAREWGVDEGVVMRWGNCVLFAVWSKLASNWTAKVEARAAYNVCEASAPIWAKVKRMLGIMCLVAIIGGGCATPPTWDCEVDGLDTIKEVIAGFPVDDSGDIEVYDSPALDWCYGGFDGSRAIEVDNCRIDVLRVRAGALTYEWVSGGCEALGAKDASDASCLACLFCEVGGKWRGGKFDWISTSRTRRGLENIESGYKGWRSEDLRRATRYAFVIVSRDGRRRSNIIFVESRK